ncbi:MULTISPECIES: substrate-binding domain-containing protein [Streptomyces]|uniref:substrate-binding domain-containing protein n=1 Tax=Streptomyces TaxID=1883 RepID=UPI000F5533E4|nr:substrate-binding domain-containing protein [Streptomyces sp. ADI97-07]RPK78046.1 Phosphate-binding protein PstS 1 precursor [Streptomyces sp. ADI97-07]WRY82883.1 substrate-binding domain-containing protein [Streptomyces clavifer]
MAWFEPENVIAVLTAALGVATSAGVLWYERRVPRRRRIGYRVQMDTPIGSGVSQGRANVRLGLFSETPDMADATLVLLRIENDGSQSIAHDDYTGRGDQPHGLTAEFTGRTVRGVAVTHSPGADHLMDHFTPAAGLRHTGAYIRLPRVPLNRNEHVKLLVLLTGATVGSPIRVTGGIRDGEVSPNQALRPDEKPPVFSRSARIITVALTLCVVTLASIILVRNTPPPPIECAPGSLTVTGSTAFAPVLEATERELEHKCEDVRIEVRASGSAEGLRRLAGEGSKPGRARATVALSDGVRPEAYTELSATPIGLSLFHLVVNDDVPVRDLRLGTIRRIYRGEILNWQEVGGPDLTIKLISRDAGSGTREVFGRRVLGSGEPAFSSRDCTTRSAPDVPYIRCELDGTEEVLSTVASVSGAIGYGELRGGRDTKGLHQLAIDGTTPSIETIGSSPYPFRETEYAYTYGRPPAGSPAAGFLDYLRHGGGQGIMREHGHLPCASPEGLRLCAGD